MATALDSWRNNGIYDVIKLRLLLPPHCRLYSHTNILEEKLAYNGITTNLCCDPNEYEQQVEPAWPLSHYLITRLEESKIEYKLLDASAHVRDDAGLCTPTRAVIMHILPTRYSRSTKRTDLCYPISWPLV